MGVKCWVSCIRRGAAVGWLVFGSLVGMACAEDVVVYATGREGRGRGTARGIVVDFTGEHLVLRVADGREQTIPASRVIEVRTTRAPEQVAGDGFVRARQYEKALERYPAALRNEQRPWVRREIMAQCVRCWCELGQFERAARGFLALVQSDPKTQFFHTIPLAWFPHQPSPAFRQQASAWLENRSSGVARLLGASWLLSTEGRAAAIGALQELRVDRDARVALLAEAQLWRTQVVRVKPQDVERWRGVIARMPERLRPGPYFVLGQALAAQGREESAALAFLRIPILYPEYGRLAAAALLSAGRELERIGQAQEAATLYQEVVRDHGDAPAAAEAASRLENLAKPAPVPRKAR